MMTKMKSINLIGAFSFSVFSLNLTRDCNAEPTLQEFSALSEQHYKNKTGNTEKPLILVKYGGSAFTKKQAFETPNQENILKTAEQVADIWAKKEVQFIIIHGAGSFGHHQAKFYELSRYEFDFFFRC